MEPKKFRPQNMIGVNLGYPTVPRVPRTSFLSNMDGWELSFLEFFFLHSAVNNPVPNHITKIVELLTQLHVLYFWAAANSNFPGWKLQLTNSRKLGWFNIPTLI